MNRNTLKYIAIFAMTLDHVAFAFVTNPYLYWIMRFIGKLTAPIMCYFLAQGFKYTSSREKYGLRLLCFALVSQIPFSLAFTGKILTTDFNMIFTLFLSFLMLYSLETISIQWLKYTCSAVCFLLCSFCDWYIIAPVMVLIFYYLQDKKALMTLAYGALSVIVPLVFIFTDILNGIFWYRSSYLFGMLLFIPLLFLYNGQSGKKSFFSKWFFYIYYPLHIFIIYLVEAFIY